MPSSKVPNRQVSLDSRRIRLEREVKIRVPQFDTFVTEYSSNISTTGMFILTNNPKPPGTLVTFEFSVADDWKLIRGQAQVVWVRHRAEGVENPPGMGVRFVELDGQSRRLIRWIVEKHIREGGKPFELDELRSVIDEALDQVIETDEPPAAGAPTAVRTPVPAKNVVQRSRKARRDSQLMPLLITAVIVVALVGALFWLTEYLPRSADEDNGEIAAVTSGEAAGEDGAGGSDAGGTEAAGTDGSPANTEPRGTDSAVAEGGGEVSADGGPPMGSAYASVTDLLRAWTGAWSSQDPDRYLSVYAEAFRPSNGASRQAWAAQRRERIQRPEFIRIAISGLEIDRVDEDRVNATFFQGYRSNTFNDEVRKRLELVWEEGTWKILREVSL